MFHHFIFFGPWFPLPSKSIPILTILCVVRLLVWSPSFGLRRPWRSPHLDHLHFFSARRRNDCFVFRMVRSRPTLSCISPCWFSSWPFSADPARPRRQHWLHLPRFPASTRRAWRAWPCVGASCTAARSGSSPTTATASSATRRSWELVFSDADSVDFVGSSVSMNHDVVFLLWALAVPCM